ncbi:hypothetical protein DACRYDRAFT_24124 [Dacryopinax primogenitus]|uniref:DUF7704 domain-containing protein n=1 Tax=Dacryopinax primogenitus (strain DJM 731) TaxID=1858805 RepID=M5FU84_DACPD|nr:uncharacterized protein DACRYDRAFT_24124 [Dacryopinax primogenitus]EJT99044.1 hypothetical protein DACRYDRAFT_24124 [Dacryopinax primogenitus]
MSSPMATPQSRSKESFPALPYPYRFLFVGLEPASLFLPFFLALLYPSWFQHQLIPSSEPAAPLGPREVMAIWQLGNCYGLLGLISSFVFRAIRDTLKDNPWAQERIIAASLTALAIADITHILLTLLALPPKLRFNIVEWNAMTWGNIPTVVVLFVGRMAWFAGVGRTSFLKQKVP